MSSRNDNAYAEHRAEMAAEGESVGWTVETCTCGWGGGDHVEDFDTKDDAMEYVRSQEYTDTSVVAVRAPDGSEVPSTEWFGK